jgi:tRNA(fMet)-specific endonuclease VapC
MILLDTDHFSVLGFPTSTGRELLTARMRASPDQQFAVTIVTVEEQMRGWLAAVNRQREVRKQLPAYDRMLALLKFLEEYDIVPVDMRAADEFERLRKQKVRIGTQDLKIASIARVQNALLLSANLRDFCKVPGLRVENWLADG